MTDEHEYSVDAARKAGERDALNDWVAEFLASPGSDNAELGEQLTKPPRLWLGPVRVHIDDLHRLAGPSDAPAMVEVDEDEWHDGVDDMEQRIRDGWEPPPVIATHQGDHLRLEDGNHRVESLRRAGIEEAWTLVGFEDAAERERFSVPEAS
jgi:hypothetical protein